MFQVSYTIKIGNDSETGLYPFSLSTREKAEAVAAQLQFDGSKLTHAHAHLIRSDICERFRQRTNAKQSDVSRLYAELIEKQEIEVAITEITIEEFHLFEEQVRFQQYQIQMRNAIYRLNEQTEHHRNFSMWCGVVSFLAVMLGLIIAAIFHL